MFFFCPWFRISSSYLDFRSFEQAPRLAVHRPSLTDVSLLAVTIATTMPFDSYIYDTGYRNGLYKHRLSDCHHCRVASMVESRCVARVARIQCRASVYALIPSIAGALSNWVQILESNQLFQGYGPCEMTVSLICNVFDYLLMKKAAVINDSIIIQRLATYPIIHLFCRNHCCREIQRDKSFCDPI